MRATYSPEDNKLRFYPSERLAPELYARVRAAGFIWAPKQGLFVAPAWSPSREDLLEELAGEVGDEDTSLVERAEDRAERFGDYSEKRAEDANAAHSAVRAIADNIPFGQPILVGHHSEKHARRDAEKIHNGMRRAVRMWETSNYWKSRAAGALRHAKFKESPEVRARRIRTLEADLRRLKNAYTPDEKTRPQVWDGVEHVWVSNGSRGGRWVKRESLAGIERGNARWIQHTENRLAYERAMLAEAGGLVTHKHEFEVGGRVLVRDTWVTILRINRGASGEVVSVRTSGRGWGVSLASVETIKDYQAPSDGDKAKAKAATKAAPLCNYAGEGFAYCTEAEWKSISADYKGTRTIEATDKAGAHRVRVALGCYVHFSTPGPTDETARVNRRHSYPFVFITDAKVKPAPAATEAPAGVTFENTHVAKPSAAVVASAADPAPNACEFKAMRESLRAGVKVVSAPQLFPTPPELARRMVKLAGVFPGELVLEPSAGTGNICRAILGAFTGANCGRLVAVELNRNLFEELELQRNRTLYANDHNFAVHQADFLETSLEDLGGRPFHRIVMNPPFENGADIKHIKHAAAMLKPGGRLVAICANGPRQGEQLRPLAAEWEALPAGTFAGTGVSAALLVIDSPAVDEGGADPGASLCPECGQSECTCQSDWANSINAAASGAAQISLF